MVDSTLPVQGEKFRSLVGELRSRLLHGEAKKERERERCVHFSKEHDYCYTKIRNGGKEPNC